MYWKNFLAAIVLAVCVGAEVGCSGRAQASRTPENRSNSGSFTRLVAGFKVRLVAVTGTSFGDRVRLADHSWTPDGIPYEGPEFRLVPRSMTKAPAGGSPKCLIFELEQPQTAKETALAPNNQVPSAPNLTKNIDVFAYLPKNGVSNGGSGKNVGEAGPLAIQVWHGVPRDSAGGVVLAAPTSVTMECGVQSTDPQPVEFGIARGEYKLVAKGPASVSGLAENKTGVLASGPWGQIEATHLTRPQIESKPSPTHRFRLLGGAFPPRTERKAFFYDEKGTLIASCGDGPNNAGYAREGFHSRIATAEIASFEVQERPYEFVQFDGVNFDAPQVKGYSGQQGLDHAVGSPIGKVLGVLKSTKDGAWSGYVLYAADGTRWIDPGTDVSPYEYGQFDPWNHPLEYRRNILFEPVHEFSTSTTPVTCEVYAADSPDGPRKEKLTSWDEMPFRMPITTIACNPTNRPYMRIEVRVGEGTWKTLETISVTDRLLKRAETAPLGTTVLEVFFDADGSIRIWKDEANPVRSRTSWSPGKQRIRVIAHLQNGKTADVDLNMSGYGGVPPNEKRYRGLEYTKQSNGTLVQSGFKRLNLKDIASFDLQVQDLKAPITIPIHSPVD